LWEGNNCEKKECNGVGKRNKNNGKCRCLGGFTGDDCENEPQEKQCSGNGVKDRGECRCFDGWTGLDCESKIQCNGRGEFVNNQCECEFEFKGKECETKKFECELYVGDESMFACNMAGECTDKGC